MAEDEGGRWNLTLGLGLRRRVESLLRLEPDAYDNATEYVRAAVREKLERDEVEVAERLSLLTEAQTSNPSRKR